MNNSTDKKSAEKSAYHHGDLKSVLLDETARILKEEGEGALSLRYLATRVGVSRTAPYHHFKDKQSLLSAVGEEGFVRFNQAMLESARKSRGKRPNDRILAWVKMYVTFAVDNSEYYDLMYGGRLWQSESLSSSLLNSARGTLRGNVERIRNAQRQGLYSQDLDPVGFSHVAWGTLHGMSRLYIDGVYTNNASRNRMCGTAADMLWAQLEPGAQPAFG